MAGLRSVLFRKWPSNGSAFYRGAFHLRETGDTFNLRSRARICDYPALLELGGKLCGFSAGKTFGGAISSC
jgi:hypothetical protein